MTPASEEIAAYRELLERLDRWFADARARHPGVIPCTGGCTACCHGPFDISVADAELLAHAVAALPAATQRDVVRRAADVMRRVGEFLPEWRPPFDIADIGDEAFDTMSDALAAEPCPLLGSNGGCLIYADRPLICRLTGLGMRTPAGRLIDNACPIQGAFPDYERLPPMEFDLEGFEVEELEAMLGAARRLFGTAAAAGYETTIAAAVLDGKRAFGAAADQR